MIAASGGLRKVRWKLEGQARQTRRRQSDLLLDGERRAHTHVRSTFIQQIKQDNLTADQLAALRKKWKGGLLMDKTMFDELLARVEEMDAISQGQQAPARLTQITCQHES